MPRPAGRAVPHSRRASSRTAAISGRCIDAARKPRRPVDLFRVIRLQPDVYKPLFWGGLWGIPFGILIGAVWKRLYLFGSLYFLAPVLALFLFFLPMSGAGYFGLQRGLRFTVYLLLVNLPYGITTALAARAIIGKKP